MSHMLTTVCSKPSAKNIAIGIHISSNRPTVLRVAFDMTDPRLTSQLHRTPMPMAANQPRTVLSIGDLVFGDVGDDGSMGFGATAPPEVNENQSSQAKNMPPSRLPTRVQVQLRTN